MKWFTCVALLAALILPAGVRAWVLSRSETRELVAEDVQTGKMLFTHVWKENDPLCPKGDGLGPVFNANSCVACHFQGGVGGGGDNKSNVFTYRLVNLLVPSQPRVGMVHRKATQAKFQERYSSIDPSLPGSTPDQHGIANLASLVSSDCTTRFEVSMRNTPALFGAKLIDELPESVILAQERRQRVKYGMASFDQETLPVGRAFLVENGRVGKFGWRAQTASLLDFVQGACANELGLGNPGSRQAASMAFTGYTEPGLDLTNEQCLQMRDFIAALPRPVQRTPAHEEQRQDVIAGERHFLKVGCAECHAPNLGSIQGIYSDLLLHRMGSDLASGSEYAVPTSSSPTPSAKPDEWRTPPLWGVADSAPYMHDGRAKSLEEAIAMHRGQAGTSAQAYRQLAPLEQLQLIAFLRSLRAP